MKHCKGHDLAGVSAGNVLIIKSSSLGDVVQSLPVLSALRRKFPKARFTWLISPPCQAIIDGHPDLDDVIVFDRARYRGREYSPGAVVRFARFLRNLRRHRFDLVIDLHGLVRSGLMAWATRAGVRVGLSSAREFASRFYTHVVEVPTMEMSAVERYWLVPDAFGVGDSDKRFVIHLADADEHWAAEQLQAVARPLLVVNAAARWATKRWPAEKFAATAQRFMEQTGGGVVLTGGPGDERLAQGVADQVTGVSLNLAGHTTVKQLAAVLRQADLMVTGDSGPMHLAAALGTPVVAIFTCTSPIRARPYSATATVVATQVDCAASYLRKCSRLDCMADVDVDRVWGVCQEHLATMRRNVSGPIGSKT